MIRETFPTVGCWVRIAPSHPRAGQRGQVIRYDGINQLPKFGPRPIIRLEDGEEIMLLRADDWEPEWV
jgi:hypothetical protein